MPGEDEKYVTNRELAFAQGFRDFVKAGVSDRAERAQQVLAGSLLHVANHGDRGHVVVRRAAAAKSRPEFLPVRLFLRSQAFGGEDLLGDGNVHQLPANVRPARSWSPRQHGMRIGFLLDAVEQSQGAGTGKLKASTCEKKASPAIASCASHRGISA